MNCTKMVNWLKHFIETIVNLRFAGLRRRTTSIMKTWSKKMDTYLTKIFKNDWTARVPKTYCPCCTIPDIGCYGYIKQNFQNMRNAIKLAARNLSITKTIKFILIQMTNTIRGATKIMITPFRLMTKQKQIRKDLMYRKSREHSNIGQYDGNQDLDGTSSEEENSFTASGEEGSMDCGWYKRQMETYAKGVGCWYNPKRQKNKILDVRKRTKSESTNPKISRSSQCTDL